MFDEEKTLYDRFRDDGMSDEEIYDMVTESIKKDSECDSIPENEKKFINWLLTFDGDKPGRISVALDEMISKYGESAGGGVAVDEEHIFEVAEKHDVRYVFEKEIFHIAVRKLSDYLHLDFRT